jgi:hypothetical protein
MTARANAAMFSVTLFTFLSWAPAALLLLLPNDWYWLVAKAVVGFALLGVILNLLPPRSSPHMGAAGWGFIFNLALFSVLLYFSMPTWSQIVGVLLIGHTMFVCFTIIRKHHDTDPLLNRIGDALRQGQDTEAKKRSSTAMGALIDATYGRNAKKTANVVEAVALASNDLLLGRFDKEDIEELAVALSNGPMPYSTHDLAASVALGLLRKVPYESRKAFFDVQLRARMAIGSWVAEGKLSPLLAQAFEQTLYKYYHPERLN